MDDAGALHLGEVGAEAVPVQDEGRMARQRKGRHHVRPRRAEGGVFALHIGRRGRQRDQVRHIARQAVQQQQRLVGAGAAHMHMLAEHGELLGQVAVQRGQLLVAGRVDDLPLRPLLERMGAAAAQRHAFGIGAGHQGVAGLAQLRQHLGMAAAHAGAQLEHAGGDLVRHLAGDAVLRHPRQQWLRARRQVVALRVDDLQLEFHAQGQRRRWLEVVVGHARLLWVGCCSAPGAQRAEGHMAGAWVGRQGADQPVQALGQLGQRGGI